jgi:hypothetical protein
MTSAQPLIAVVRRSLLAILTIGLIGTEIELFLLKHTDGFWQIVPLGLVGAESWWWRGVHSPTTRQACGCSTS